MFTRSSEYDTMLADAILVFKSTVKLAIGDASSSQANAFFIKTKIIGLEIFETVLENPKQVLTTHKEFINIIRTQLCDGLLRHVVNVVNTEN